MRFFLVLFLAVILVFIGIQAYRLHEQEAVLSLQDAQLDAEAQALMLENQKFEDDLEFLQQDRNIAKELQSKFNYRRPEEKMFMLVPAE